MEKNKEIEKKMQAVFALDDVEYCIVSADSRERKILVSPYISARAVICRLDELLGNENWYDSYILSPNGVLCKLSITLEGKTSSKEGVVIFAEYTAKRYAPSLAFAKAAAKFGLGRTIICSEEIWVSLEDKKPQEAVGKIHFIDTKELSGWWIEPKLLSDGRIEEITPSKQSGSAKDDTAEFKALILPQKLAKLAELKIITQKKYSDYQAKLEDKATAPGLLRYFEKQFDLLYALHALAIGNKISLDQKATIYKRVMSSKLNGFPAIEAELKSLKEAA